MLLAAAMIFKYVYFRSFAEDSTTNEEAADAVLSSAAGTELASMPNDDVQYADAYKFDYSMGLFEMLEDGYWQNEKVTKSGICNNCCKKCLRQTQPAIRDTAAHHMLILTLKLCILISMLFDRNRYPER